MALGGCAAEVYGASLDGYEGQRGALWRSGLLCAISAREIARCSNGKASPEVAYTAGILHDIGKSVISEWLEGKSREMVSKADSSATDYITLEQEVTGTNHCQVGFALAKRWKLPDVLCEAIAYHHHPQEASEKFRATVYAVHLGDMLAMMRGTDTGADGMRYKIDEKYRDYITISINELERISFQAGLEFKKISDSLYGESGGE
jgi:putative nucleotidyltransferase with HDIG domain